jgi:SP family xylose:H+ symportor-like MFS transporter
MQPVTSLPGEPQPLSTAELNLRYITLICSVAALGGLLFGYDWVVIGGAKPFYEAYFRLRSTYQIGWANSCALLGCLLGSILSGFLSGRFGRKSLLLLSALMFAISSLFTGLASSFVIFIVWRILGGVAIGISSNASPTYIAEVSPAQWRGRLVSLNQMTIVIGILLAQIVNWLIADRVPAAATEALIRNSWNGQTGWRMMFIAVAVPSLLFLVSALFVPESPRWLISRGRDEQARRIFSKIGGPAYSARAVEQVEMATAEPRSSRAFSIRSPGLRRVLLIGVVLAVLQQWSGINVLFNYAEEIYREAGYSVDQVLFNIVITGSINLIFTFLALRTVDRWGRRTLMLIGCGSVAACHLLIAVCYLLRIHGVPLLLATLLTIGSYAMSLAPVTWVLISEIFPLRFRSEGVAISVSALWIASFVLTFTFPLLNASLGPAGTFFLYAFICAAGYVFVFRFVPETKGKTLEELERQFATQGA